MHVARAYCTGLGEFQEFENVAHGCAGFASPHFETGWALFEAESGASRLFFLYVVVFSQVESF